MSVRYMRSFLFWLLVPIFFLSFLAPAQSACGEATQETLRALSAAEQALRATGQAVQSSRTRMQQADAALREVLAHPPADYDQTLARQVATLRYTEVEPKRQTLEHLRGQHEEARRQWERGHQMLGPQLAEAQAAFQSQTMPQEEYCQIREAYLQALHLYLQGMQRYRTGMDLYARALAAYTDQLLIPYMQGFTDRQQWEILISQLQKRDFLHEFLLPLTANAIRIMPPDSPPE